MADDGKQNADLFASAIESLRAMEPIWRQQIELALGHEAELVIDWDSLGGRYERMQPFIHQVIAGALEAIVSVGFSPATQTRLRESVRRVVIGLCEEGKAGGVMLADTTLVAHMALAPEMPAPRDEIIRAIQALLAPKPQDAPSNDAVAMEETAGKAAAGEAAAGKAALKKKASRKKTSKKEAYKRATQYMEKLEAALRANGLWPGEPPRKPAEVKGAFGCENMPFTQWLAWILIPRVREIVTERGEFPDESAVAVYAMREFDGVPDAQEALVVLMDFDGMINGLEE
ncbi:MAG: YqcC family protein [Candidatus Sumerlaeota bacterium]|nr:YqcC family protein [Candidatus Sumerlaeota bacterium]